MKNIFPHKASISLADRLTIKNQNACVLWFTGLSGSGKSTIANRLEERLLNEYSTHTYLLDGDNIRSGLNSDLGFSKEDRIENIRRIGEISKLFYDAGLVVITAFISPFISDRDAIRSSLPEASFIEVFVNCPLEICEKRDPKNLYKKARQGELKDFTGIDSAYERPISPQIELKSDKMSVDECVDKVIEYLIKNNKIGK